VEPNKVGQFILQLRKKHNLTQQEFADLFGVTYQAVSKWENGKNIPDLLTLKAICQKYNVDINEILDGKEFKKPNRLYIILFSIFSLMGLIAILLVVPLLNKNDFEFKTLSSDCGNFNIFGSLAYNSNRTHIYISKVEYCGGDDTTKYAKIECVLYESKGEIEQRIDSHSVTKPGGITLEEFLKDLSFNIDNYSALCKEFSESNIFLQIYATDKNDKVTSYKIPLNAQEKCHIDD